MFPAWNWLSQENLYWISTFTGVAAWNYDWNVMDTMQSFGKRFQQQNHFELYWETYVISSIRLTSACGNWWRVGRVRSLWRKRLQTRARCSSPILEFVLLSCAHGTSLRLVALCMVSRWKALIFKRKTTWACFLGSKTSPDVILDSGALGAVLSVTLWDGWQTNCGWQSLGFHAPGLLFWIEFSKVGHSTRIWTPCGSCWCNHAIPGVRLLQRLVGRRSPGLVLVRWYSCEIFPMSTHVISSE